MLSKNNQLQRYSFLESVERKIFTIFEKILKKFINIIKKVVSLQKNLSTWK